MIRKIYFLLVCLFLSAFNLFAQQGVHGPRTVTAANTIVNEYTTVTAAIGLNSTSITVANSALNGNGRFPGNLQPAI